MLSKTFRTAKELKISQAKYDALVKVYWMFVDEKIPARLFDMGTIGTPKLKDKKACGTAGCILGWCHAVDPIAYYRRQEFGWAGSFPDYSGGLHYLFFSGCACDGHINPTRAQAAQAIHNFLTTGAARWREVLKGE